MISENHKFMLCARIRDELPGSFGRLLLKEMEDDVVGEIPTLCPWQDSFQFYWELYFYLFLANDGYKFSFDKLREKPFLCPFHPWYHGLTPSELVILANVVGRLEEIRLDTGVNPDKLNDIIEAYRSDLMEWHDEEAAIDAMKERLGKMLKSIGSIESIPIAFKIDPSEEDDDSE